MPLAIHFIGDMTVIGELATAGAVTSRDKFMNERGRFVGGLFLQEDNRKKIFIKITALIIPLPDNIHGCTWLVSPYIDRHN